MPYGLEYEIPRFEPLCLRLADSKASIAPVDTVTETGTDFRKRESHLCRGQRSFVQDNLSVGRGEIR